MITADIESIEAALRISLPKHYVELVTNYPQELLGTEAEDFALINNAKQLISENHSVRTGPFYGSRWPSNLLLIGTNGCGDFYVTTLEAKGFSTGFFDHEQPAFLPHSNSRQEFIQKILSEQAG